MKNLMKIPLLLFCMLLGIGQAWGATETFTASDLKTNPKTKSGITCTMASSVTVGNQQIWKNGGSTVKADVIQIANSANQTWSTHYFEISSESEITDVTFTAVNNQSGTSYSIPVVYWEGAAAAAFDGYEMVSLAPKDATVAPAAQSLTIPSGTKTVRFYRTIRTNAAYTEFSNASGYKTLGDGKTAYIISVEVTTASSDECTPLVVNFAAGEGTGSMTAGECCPGKTYTIPECTFTAPEGKEFDKWTSSPSVTITDGKFTMPEDAITLTATWKDKPAEPRTMFSLETKTSFSTLSVNAGSQAEVNSTYATINGGSAIVKNADGSNGKIQLTTSGVYFNGSNAYLYIALDEALHAGDVITFTSGNNNQICFTLDATRSTSLATAEKSYTIPTGSPLIGATELYIWRVPSSSTYIKTLNIKTTAAYVAPVYHSVTFDMQGATSAAIEAQSVKDGQKAVKPADPEKTGYDFVKWVVAATNADYDFDAAVTAGVALKAVWQTAAVMYTVTYKDGETTLDTEEVTEGQKAANVPAPTKDLYTFAGWEDAEHNAVDLATATIGAPLTVYAKWTPWGYASSVDLAAEAAGSKTAIASFLAAANIDSKLGGKGAYDTNNLYTGYKMKNNGDYITFNLQSGKRLKITMGYVETGVTITVGGVAQSFTTSKTQETVFTYDATADVVVKLVNNSADDKTSTLKSIEIADIPVLSDDATLKSLKYGETNIDLAANKFVYNVTLPYGSATPEVSAVANDEEHATVLYFQADFAAEPAKMKATVRVLAEDGVTTKDYEVRFTIAPKMGTRLIHAQFTGNAAISVVAEKSLIGGTVTPTGSLNSATTFEGETGYKFQTNNKVALALAEGSFKAGDMLEVFVTTAQAKPILAYSDEAGTEEKEVARGAENMTAGSNFVLLTADADVLYFVRNANGWNPNVAYFAVYRDTVPVITSFVIGEAEGVIDQAAKTIVVPMAPGSDVTALTPVVVAFGNNGATYAPAGVQDFTNPVAYTVTDGYNEQSSVYTVSVEMVTTCPEAVAISGEQTYLYGATIELTAAQTGSNTLDAVTYQWYKDGELIEGATNAVFTKTAVMEDAGEYVVKVNQNECVEVSSAAYAVVVNKIAVSKVALSATEVELKVGETTTVTATITPANASFPEITLWEMPENNGAPYFSVDGGNPTTLTALAPTSGKNIYATADGKKSSGFSIKAYCEVTFANCDAIEPMKYYASALALPTPTGGNAPFLGWYESADFSGAKVSMTSYKTTTNVTLYAKWTTPDAETPVITTHPASNEYAYGTTTFAALSVVAAPATGYQWFKNDVAIEGATEATYTPATIGTYYVKVTNHVDGYNDVTVQSDDAKISVAAPVGGYTQLDVTGDMTWDFSKAPVDVNQVADDGIKSTEVNQVMANIANVQTNAEIFFSEALVMGNAGEFVYRKNANDMRCFQGKSLKFHTTIPGTVTINARRAGSSGTSHLTINTTDFGNIGSTAKDYTGFVEAGDVEILVEGDQAIRIFTLTFTAASVVRAGVEAGRMYTYCPLEGVDKDFFSGAEFYVPENFDGSYVNLIKVDELTAGYGYIMVPTASTVYAAFDGVEAENGEAVAASVETHGMQGHLGAQVAIESSHDNVVIVSNHLYYAKNNVIDNGRAYIRLDIVKELEAEPENLAPRRRVGFAANGATDLVEIFEAENVQKVLIDGAIYIIREGQMFTVTGQLVK